MRLLPEDPETRSLWRVNQVLWLCVVAVGIWTGLALVFFPNPGRIHPAFGAVFALAAANLALRSVSARRRRNNARFDNRIGWLFTAIDLVLIALGLRLTGGVNSPLWIVLFVLVMAETLLSPPGEARLVRWGAGIALVAGTWSSTLAPVSYLFEIVPRLFFLTVVSVITRRQRENAAAKDAELAGLRAELGLARERAHLSREIHDGVGNALAAAVLRLEVAARVGEKRPGEIVSALKDEAQALREAMNAVRDWTFFVRPWGTGTDRPQASAVLAREISRLEQRTGLPIHLEGAALLDDLNEPARLALFRITQEALTNSFKHAQAHNIRVSLERTPLGIRLSVADDGRGFEAGDARSGAASVGLASMRERAEALGGAWELRSTPGSGTTITVQLP